MARRLAAALVIFGWAAFAAAEPPRLLVLPFEFLTQQPLAQLERALPDLLASRIGQSREVVVLQADLPAGAPAERQSFSSAQARELGRARRAQYVLSGRFTEIGNRFSIDAALIDVRSGDAAERYAAEGSDIAQFIPKLGELAGSVRQRFAALAKAAPQAAAANAAPPSVSVQKPWVSAPLAIEIRGLGVGQVWGPGSNDIVLITRQEVQVYRRRAEQLELLARHRTDRTLENIGVDVADLDGDGRAEIYVTASAAGNSLASYVLQRSGAGLQLVAARLPWHLRLAELIDGPALLGQQRGMDQFFTGPIRRLAWRDGKLAPGEALKLPGHVTLFSFVVADLNGDGQPKVVSLRSRAPLTVYDAKGAMLRRGAEYGQSAIYVVEKRERNDAPAEEAQLPGRLRTVRLPGRGTSLLAAQNHESIGFLYRARNFTGGEIVALRWQEDGLAEVWRSDRLAYVADFQVSALEPGAAPTLVIGTVASFEGMFDAPRSFIVLAPLQQ